MKYETHAGAFIVHVHVQCTTCMCSHTQSHAVHNCFMTQAKWVFHIRFIVFAVLKPYDEVEPRILVITLVQFHWYS